MALFKKVCPRCGRRYPKNFDACLECGASLVDTDREAQKAELRKYLPMLGVILAAVLLLAAVLYIVIPIVQLSVATGQETGTLGKTQGRQMITTYTMNQPASDGRLQVTVTGIRDGAKSANSRKFVIVAVTLQNLQQDKEMQVSAADFLLLGPDGTTYPSYGVSDKVYQTLKPGSSGTYDVIFEVPQDPGSLRLQYTFAGTGDRSAQAITFFLS
jgi:hypothetical protein